MPSVEQSRYPENKDGTQEAVESVEALPIRDQEKISLLLVLARAKPAAYISVKKLWEPGQQSETVSEAEIEHVTTTLRSLGLVTSVPFISREEAHMDHKNGICFMGHETVHLFSSYNKEVVNQCRAARTTKPIDDYSLGKLLGFPESAVQAFGHSTSEKLYIPEEILRQDFMAFCLFKLSVEKRKEEIELVKQWAATIQELAPGLYSRMVANYHRRIRTSDVDSSKSALKQ